MTTGKVEYCHLCKVAMTEEVSLHQNCGGDCLLCMADSGDEDCMETVARIQAAGAYGK